MGSERVESFVSELYQCQQVSIDNAPNRCLQLIERCCGVVEGDAFLGRGAFGRVFKVRRGQEVFALKIVEGDSIGRLYQEEGALARAQHTGLMIRAAGKCIEIPNGAAVLLSPVGTPLPRPRTSREVLNLFELLLP